MKILLLFALACLVSATKKPLMLSGKFHTIYLASKLESIMDENSEFRMMMREVNYFQNYTSMSMTYYVRTNGKCQLHKVWAEKFEVFDCYKKFKDNFLTRSRMHYPLHHRDISDNFNNENCQGNGTENILGTWIFHDSSRHFSRIYYYPRTQGGLTKFPSNMFIVIHLASNTTILFEALFINDLGYRQKLTAALARGTNITEQMWKEYVKLTRQLNIPNENIKNVYETDACPKLEQ